MEFWQFWWVPSVQDLKQCRLANCDESEKWIQTSSHSYAGIPLTLWPVLSDNVAVFRCTWRSRGWYCDGKAWCRRIVMRCAEFDACYPERQQRCLTGCGAQHDTDCPIVDDKEVVGVQTSQCETTCLDTEGQCKPHSSRLAWDRASISEDSCGEIHFPGWFRSMEGS